MSVVTGEDDWVLLFVILDWVVGALDDGLVGGVYGDVCGVISWGRLFEESSHSGLESEVCKVNVDLWVGGIVIV